MESCFSLCWELHANYCQSMQGLFSKVFLSAAVILVNFGKIIGERTFLGSWFPHCMGNPGSTTGYVDGIGRVKELARCQTTSCLKFYISTFFLKIVKKNQREYNKRLFFIISLQCFCEIPT